MHSLGMVLLSQSLSDIYFFRLCAIEILLLLGPLLFPVVKHLLIQYLAQSVLILLTLGLTFKQIKPLGGFKKSAD